MSFLDRPYDATRTARSSRDVCRDAVAIERPEPPRRGQLRFIVGACVLIILVNLLLVLIGATR